MDKETPKPRLVAAPLPVQYPPIVDAINKPEGGNIRIKQKYIIKKVEAWRLTANVKTSPPMTMLS